jgi:hypothetical protein
LGVSLLFDDFIITDSISRSANWRNSKIYRMSPKRIETLAGRRTGFSNHNLMVLVFTGCETLCTL